MDRPRWTLRILLGCWIAAIGVANADGQTSGRDRGRDRPRVKVYGPYRGAAQSARPFVGVMGAVGRAGVYEIDAASAPLTSVIKMAGGLAADASPTVRVIRDGRVAFQSYLAERTPVTVSPGDLIVVSRRRRQRAGNARTAAEAAGNGQSVGVEIALVNLIDRPVVMRIREEHATVGAIASLLGQDARSIERVQTIYADRRHRPSDTNRLVNGTVVVFDTATVRRDRVPELPAPLLVPQRKLPAGRRQSVPSRQNENHDRSGKYHRSSHSRIIQTGGYDVRKTLEYSDDNVPTLAQVQRNRKKSVLKLLVSAREDLAAGRISEAVRKARHAQMAEVEFELLEDRPELVLAAAKQIAETDEPSVEASSSQPLLRAPETGPAASANVAKSLSKRNDLPLRSGAAESALEGANATAPDLPSTQKTMTSRAPETASIPEAGDSKQMLKAMERTDRIAVESLFNAPPEPEKQEPKETEDAGWDMVRSIVAVVAVSAIFVVSWLLLSIGRKTTPKVTPKKVTTPETVLDRLIRNELPIQDEPPTFPAALDVPNESPIANVTTRIEPAHSLQPGEPNMPVEQTQPTLRPHFQPRVEPTVAARTTSVAPVAPPATVADAVQEPAAMRIPEAPLAPATPAGGTGTDHRHSVPPPSRRTARRMNSSDALGRALSALRDNSTQEGRTA